MNNEIAVINGNNLPAVKLDNDIIRQYFCEEASDKECMMFIKLCQLQKLNPWLREVYLVKYGKKPAQMVTGKETFLKRAARNPKFKGHKSYMKDDTETNKNNFTAIAEVYMAGYSVPITCQVDFGEYAGYTKDFKTGGQTLNYMWKNKPKTMLKKVALVQALREAMPEEFGGLYSQEEINTVEMEKLKEEPIKPDDKLIENTNKAVEREDDRNKNPKKNDKIIDINKEKDQKPLENIQKNSQENVKSATQDVEKKNTAKDTPKPKKTIKEDKNAGGTSYKQINFIEQMLKLLKMTDTDYGLGKGWEESLHWAKAKESIDDLKAQVAEIKQ